MQAAELNEIIIASLVRQGFVRTDDGIQAPSFDSKSQIRDLHHIAIEHKRKTLLATLGKHRQKLNTCFASVDQINLNLISPELVEVMPNTEDELLFRYATLQWSIPVSSGYGRRLRFLVKDKHNNKLIGLIGLGDPVYSLRSRDEWIGWGSNTKKTKLRYVMDAFVLGAVKPYSDLLCGKLVAMLVASAEVQRSFARKYSDRASLISKTSANAPLALITTLSALGRSSIYNRLRLNGKPLYVPVGYSSGSGEFQFSNGTYQALFSYVKANGTWSAKKSEWGTGSRNRREVIRKALQMLNLPERLLYHGVKRQIFVVPLAVNTRAFLSGEDGELDVQHMTCPQIFQEFSTRWLFRPGIESRRLTSFEPDHTMSRIAPLGG